LELRLDRACGLWVCEPRTRAASAPARRRPAGAIPSGPQGPGTRDQVGPPGPHPAQRGPGPRAQRPTQLRSALLTGPSGRAVANTAASGPSHRAAGLVRRSGSPATEPSGPGAKLDPPDHAQPNPAPHWTQWANGGQYRRLWPLSLPPLTSHRAARSSHLWRARAVVCRWRVGVGVGVETAQAPSPSPRAERGGAHLNLRSELLLLLLLPGLQNAKRKTQNHDLAGNWKYNRPDAHGRSRAYMVPLPTAPPPLQFLRLACSAQHVLRRLQLWALLHSICPHRSALARRS
jgi:hypothetical protein